MYKGASFNLARLKIPCGGGADFTRELGLVSPEMKSGVTIVGNLAKAVFKDKHGLWETVGRDNLTGNYE